MSLWREPFGSMTLSRGAIWLGLAALLWGCAHGSGAQTGAAAFYLKPLGRNFEVVRQFPFAIDGSIMGNPPEWEVSEAITDLPVIVSIAEGVWQGTYCATTTLTETWPVADGETVSFRSAFDNSGGSADRDAVQSITGKIGNVQKNKSFDVEFTGTRTFTHRYQRAFESYRRLPDDTKEELPAC